MAACDWMAPRVTSPDGGTAAPDRPAAGSGPGGHAPAGRLSSGEAAARLDRYGPNAVPEERPHLMRALLGKLSGPVPWMLDATVVLEAVAGVAKAPASVVLTTEGLGGVIAAVEIGRRVYQRMLTYTLNKIVKTFQMSLFLGLGLLLAGVFVTTPRLILLLLFANDFVTMSIATDRVRFSPRPDRWQVPALSAAALAIAVPWLAFSFATFYVGRDVAGLGLPATQTLVFVMTVATGQATVYLVRERRHLWQSRPGTWMLAATALDLAATGTLMAPVSMADIAILLAAVAAATLLMDVVKTPLLGRLRPQAAST